MITKNTKRQSYSDDDATILVEGIEYKTFKSLEVSRSIDNVCGEFRITISRPVKSESPFKSGSLVDIKLGKIQVMRGRVYETLLEGDASSDDITIVGRDITGDLIDSTVPDEAKVYSGGVSLLDIANKVITSLRLGGSPGIGIINISGARIKSFSEAEIVSCEVGERAIAFLQKYCRKRQLFLTTSNDGDLAFFRASGATTGNRIINRHEGISNNNVIRYSSKYNISDRYARYICKSQDAEIWAEGNTSGSADEVSVDAVGFAIDPDIRISRELEFKLEEAGNSVECTRRAAEESNVRSARAFEYTALVQGFKDRVFWDINQFVDIFDAKADVSGKFLIKAVTYKIDIRTGSTTKIVAVNQNAYTAEAAINLRDKQTSKAGEKWRE